MPWSNVEAMGQSMVSENGMSGQDWRRTAQFLFRTGAFEEDVELERSIEGLLYGVQVAVGIYIVWECDDVGRVRECRRLVRGCLCLGIIDNSLKNDVWFHGQYV